MVHLLSFNTFIIILQTLLFKYVLPLLYTSISLSLLKIYVLIPYNIWIYSLYVYQSINQSINQRMFANKFNENRDTFKNWKPTANWMFLLHWIKLIFFSFLCISVNMKHQNHCEIKWIRSQPIDDLSGLNKII